MLTELKEQVHRANLELVRGGLVIHAFGNASAVDSARRLVAIKPSGVPYERLAPDDIVIVSLETGEVVEGKLRPSSDTPTHLLLYREIPSIGGVVHTHSLYATAWAQGCREIPPFGTTHADHFHGPIPCTRMLTAEEIAGDYEANTGRVIVERMKGLDPGRFPGVLVAGHGPFTWGKDAAEAVHNAGVLEHLARLASETLRISPETKPIPDALLDKHFFRKHGPGAYYGQDERK
jgi:L-ribulose-5-phosphate 4-epimerase